MISRRNFLATGAVASLAIASSPFSRAADYTPDKFGVQLWVLRELMAKDFDGTLAKVAAIGIKRVEFAGFYNRTAKDVRASLSAAGLTASGAHCLQASMSDDEVHRTIDFCHEVGMPYMIAAVPSIKPNASGAAKAASGNPFDHIELEDWRWSADRFNTIGARVREAGMRFAYHNHNIEARKYGDIVAFDEIIRLTDPAVVDLEFDIGNFIAGGGDPYPYLGKVPASIRSSPTSRNGPRAVHAHRHQQLPQVRRIRTGFHRLEEAPRRTQESGRAGNLHRAGRHRGRRRTSACPPGISVPVSCLNSNRLRLMRLGGPCSRVPQASRLRPGIARTPLTLESFS